MTDRRGRKGAAPPRLRVVSMLRNHVVGHSLSVLGQAESDMSPMDRASAEQLPSPLPAGEVGPLKTKPKANELLVASIKNKCAIKCPPTTGSEKRNQHKEATYGTKNKCMKQVSAFLPLVNTDTYLLIFVRAPLPHTAKPSSRTLKQLATAPIKLMPRQLG